MATLAIRGHEKRGKEVIEILEMLGGNNKHDYSANCDNLCFFCGKGNNIIYYDWVNNRHRAEDTTFFTLEEFLEKFPYKVGDKVSSKYLKNYKIAKMEWEDTNNRVIYKLQGMGWYSADELQPYKEETMEDPKKVMFEANAQCCDIMNHLIKEETMKEKDEKSANHVFDTEIISFDIAQRDKYELDLQGKFKVVLREGVYYVERIKPQYPKNYEECCKIVNASPYVKLVYNISDGHKYSYDEDNLQLYENIRRLKICRDAYWKIAGEQMGLGKPWEPTTETVYCISRSDNVIQSSYRGGKSNILEFPTEEMRDAFYENFKSLIEECKELL